MALLAAVVLAVVGLLPIANWIGGGHAAPWYGERWALWGPGLAIVVGIAAIGFIILRRNPTRWPADRWDRVAAHWERAAWRADLYIALLAFATYLAVAYFVLSARPLLIDEIIQLYQAEIFASGRLWLPAAAHPEFTGAMHLLDMAGKVYGQFPAGGPAMLTLGVWLGVPAVIGPLAASAGVFAFARTLRLVGSSRGTSLAAVLLFAFAPFTAFLAGSMMNHVTTLAWLLGAAWALALCTVHEEPRPLAALALGLSLGIAATIRPVDAAAFALPAGLWMLWRTIQDRRQLGALLWSGVGVAMPLVALLAVNAAWTGDPFRFGYIELWGKSHELGFHLAPWGFPHTPARGLELINLYLLRLQTYFFETPVPSLLFATGALALAPQPLRGFDRWVLGSSGLLLVAYWAYWHDGFYLGPRFMLPLAPWLAWWTARLPAMLRARQVSREVERSVVVAGMVALVMGAVQLLPIRVAQYHNGMLSMRIDAAGAARAAGIRNALLLVREPWGAQMVARMWGIGVSRTETEQIYRTTDACVLDSLIGRVERNGGGGEALRALVAPARADSGRLISSTLSPDTTLRALPGSEWGARCIRRVLEDRAGTTPFAPLLLARGDGNVWVRDLHARDMLLPDSLVNREWWLVSMPYAVGSPMRFEPINRDSVRREWAQ